MSRQKGLDHQRATMPIYDCTGCPHRRIRPWTRILDRIGRGIRSFPRLRPAGCTLGLDAECQQEQVFFDEWVHSTSWPSSAEMEALEQTTLSSPYSRRPNRASLVYPHWYSPLLEDLSPSPSMIRLILLLMRDTVRCIRERAFRITFHKGVSHASG